MGTDPQDDGVETAMLQQVLGGTKNHSIQGAILLTRAEDTTGELRRSHLPSHVTLSIHGMTVPSKGD